MAFLRLLFYGGLIFTTAIASFVDENPRKSLIALNNHFNNVVPVQYDVKLRPYFEEDQDTDELYLSYKTDIEKHQTKGSFIFHGELNIAIDIFHPTTKIRLNSLRSILHLHGEVRQRDTMFGKYLVKNFEYDAVTQICDLYFDEKLPRGSYILNIIFLNAINSTENIILSLNTIRKNEFGQYRWSEATHFQAVGARRLFPCWDEPTIKATFNISIMHNRRYQVFSNMPKREEIIKHEEYKTKTNIMWTYFDITPAMSTDIVTLVITPTFHLFDYQTDRIIIWHRSDLRLIEHMKYAQMVANKVMLQLKVKWGNLKIPKVQFVAIFDLQYDNQNWGLMLNRETSMLYNENLHSVAHKIKVARLIGREMMYQWFGNLINSFWSSHLWLIDGLTMLFGIDIINSIENYRNSEMLDLFIVEVQFDSLRLDTNSFMKPLITEVNPFEINSFSYFSRYIKAPLILRMLQYLITDGVFGKSIHQYINEHALNLSTLDDFWNFMQTAVDELHDNPLHLKQNMLLLTTIMNNWIRHMGYPVLKITRDYSKNSVKIAVENYYVFEEYLFWIPVTYTTQNESNFTNLKSPLCDQRLIFMRSDESSYYKQVVINDDGWVIFNLQQAGYYRVNYDPENWQKIAKYLNSNEYTKIHVLNRAKIIDDAFYFMVEHQLDSSIFWNLTNYLAQETNYIAWYPMIKIFEYMSSIFPLPNKKVQNIKNKITKILSSLLRKIKYEEDSEENDLTKCLRQEAVKWACILDDLDCQRKAYDKLLMRVQKQETNKLLPWWKEWIYCKGLMLANSPLWHKVREISISEKKIDRFSKFLACAPNKIMDEYLELIMFKENEDLSEIDIKIRINSFLLIIAKHAKHDNVLSNILKNIDKIKPRDINGIAIFIIIVNHVYSKEQIDKVRKNMKRIIAIEAYIYHITCIYKKNRSLFDRAIIEAHFYEYKNLVEQWMLYAEHKLQMRLYEIVKQIAYLNYFSE